MMNAQTKSLWIRASVKLLKCPTVIDDDDDDDNNTTFIIILMSNVSFVQCFIKNVVVTFDCVKPSSTTYFSESEADI